MNAKVILLPCAIVVAAAATPAGAAGWSPARPLVKERGTDPVSLHLAVDDAGNSAFVWTSGTRVRARVRTASGRLGAVATLHRSRYGFMALPQVALAPRGRAVAIWEENATRGPLSRWNVYAAVASHGRFGQARLLGRSTAYPDGGTGAAAEGDSPKVAVAQDGSAVLLWRRDPTSLQAVRLAPTGRFGPVQTIVPRSGGHAIGAAQISLGIDGGGTARAAWTSYNVASPDGRVLEKSAGVRVAAWPRTAARFGPARVVSTLGDRASQARMAVGRDGTVVAVWPHSVPDDPAEAVAGPIEAALATRGGAVSAPQLLDASCDGTRPDVAVGTHGEAAAIWIETCNFPGPLVGAGAPAGGSFGPVEPIYTAPSAARVTGFARVAAAPAGAFVTAFSPGVMSSLRPAGGPFSQPQTVGTSPGYATTPRVAAGQRLAIVAWQGKGGFFYATIRP
jgi:hypothetical protein